MKNLDFVLLLDCYGSLLTERGRSFICSNPDCHYSEKKEES